MTKYKDELLDHEYDGIYELDNDLPPWWLYLFYITIIWSVLYLVYYHVFAIGYLQEDEYRQEVNPRWTRDQDPEYHPPMLFSTYHSPYYNPVSDLTPRERLLAAGITGYIEDSPENEPDYEALIDEQSIASGKAVFTKNCISCHGKLGEGGIGPNLTDEYWLHGAGINNVVKTIKFGVPAKGMISWRSFLKRQQIHEVASYILTLQGTNPPNAKAPQGDKEDE